MLEEWVSWSFFCNTNMCLYVFVVFDFFGEILVNILKDYLMTHRIEERNSIDIRLLKCFLSIFHTLTGWFLLYSLQRFIILVAFQIFHLLLNIRRRRSCRGNILLGHRLSIPTWPIENVHWTWTLVIETIPNIRLKH